MRTDTLQPLTPYTMMPRREQLGGCPLPSWQSMCALQKRILHRKAIPRERDEPVARFKHFSLNWRNTVHGLVASAGA